MPISVSPSSCGIPMHSIISLDIMQILVVLENLRTWAGYLKGEPSISEYFCSDCFFGSKLPSYYPESEVDKKTLCMLNTIVKEWLDSCREPRIDL